SAWFGHANGGSPNQPIHEWCVGHWVTRPSNKHSRRGLMRSKGTIFRFGDAQIAIAWVLRQEGVLTIPKATKPDHVRANREALDIRLTHQDLEDLAHEFPTPSRKVPLEMSERSSDTIVAQSRDEGVTHTEEQYASARWLARAGLARVRYNSCSSRATGKTPPTFSKRSEEHT